MTTSVGIIGVGHLAGYLVEGLRCGGDGPVITLSPRNAGKSGALAERFGARVAADNVHVVEEADTVILATRPAQAVHAATGLPWRVGQVLICVAAGIPLDALVPVAGPATVVRATGGRGEGGGQGGWVYRGGGRGGGQPLRVSH